MVYEYPCEVSTTDNLSSLVRDLTEDQLVAHVARRFYLEDESKVAIAKSLGLSRFKVARLLATGQEKGIVRIEILEPTTDLPTFSTPLAKHLSLNHVRVIDSRGDAGQIRAQLGAMAAQYLAQQSSSGQTIGIGWGRTMTEVARHLPPLAMVTAVQIMGATHESSPQFPIEIIRDMIEVNGGTAHSIFEPLYVGESTELQRRIRGLTYELGLFDHLDTAVLSIGSWAPPTTQLRESLPPILRQRLDASNPAAEIGGIWLSHDATVVCPEITRQCITIAPHQLLETPEVLAVAGGQEKADAIYATARSGLLTSLITDRRTAECLLERKPVINPTFKRL